MGVTKYDRSADRPSPYGVKWTVNGKRKFKFFKTKGARNDYFDAMTRQAAIQGKSILNITAAEAAVMRECVDLLGSAHEVIIACKEYAKRNTLVDIVPSEAIKEYIDEKTKIGRDDNYIRAIKNILERGEKVLPDSFNKWKTAICHNWILDLTFEPVTVKHHAKTFVGFCNWCMRKKYIWDNPFVNAPIPDVIQKEVEFLTVKQTQKLFKNAVKYYPKAVAYLALNCFAGLRSSACARLPFKDINFEQKGFTVQANIAKNKRRVYLDGHEPNLWLWLEWARDNAPEGFEFSKTGWDKIRAKVSEKAGVKMPKNALRHSFCTYHVALNGDAGKTATLLTQRGEVSILYEHYKGNASRQEAEKFWSIEPESCTD